MLVLTRKVDQGIVITTSQGDIVVKVLKVMKSQVKLGISAPREVSIMREEIELSEDPPETVPPPIGV